MEKDKFETSVTVTEEKLSGIWKETFSLERVGMLENFFTIGGNSLKAVQLVARIEKAFQKRLSIGDIFNNPTIRELAVMLEPEPVLLMQDIRKLPVQPYYELSQGQHRLWIEVQLDADKSVSYNVQAVELIQERVQHDLLDKSIELLVGRHESLRTSFHLIGDIPSQQIHESSHIVVSYHDLCGGDDPYKEAEAIIHRQHSEQFDLRFPVLLRVSLIELSGNENYIAVTVHHIVCDGMSMTILLKELKSIYTALVKKEEPALPVLPVQYKDYAYWHNQRLRSKDIGYQREYWHQKLSGVLPEWTIPLDHPRGQSKIYEPGMVRIALRSELSGQLKAMRSQYDLSYFTIFLAGVKSLISLYSQRSDIIVGSPFFGRTRPELEGMVGMFVNTLVLRDRIGGEDTFLDVAARVKRTVVEATENQDYPYDWLVGELLPNRDRARNPFFDLVVDYNEFMPDDHWIAGKQQARLVENGALKYDLAFLFTGLNTIYCSIFFDSSLFEKNTIAILAEQYSALMAAVLREPDSRLMEIGKKIAGYKEVDELVDDFRSGQETDI